MDTYEREQLSNLSRQLTGLSEQFAGFDRRLAGVESTYASLDRRLAVVESNYATKADVLSARVSIIMWIVSAVLFTQVIPTLLKTVTG